MTAFRGDQTKDLSIHTSLPIHPLLSLPIYFCLSIDLPIYLPSLPLPLFNSAYLSTSPSIYLLDLCIYLLSLSLCLTLSIYLPSLPPPLPTPTHLPTSPSPPWDSPRRRCGRGRRGGPRRRRSDRRSPPPSRSRSADRGHGRRWCSSRTRRARRPRGTYPPRGTPTWGGGRGKGEGKWRLRMYMDVYAYIYTFMHRHTQ